MPKVKCYKCGHPFEPYPDALRAWVESDRIFDPTDWICPGCSNAEDRHPLSLGESVAMLRDGDQILTGRYAFGYCTLVCASWPRTELIAAIEKYGAELTGPLAAHSGFGMALLDEHGYLFIRTKKGEANAS